jgi:hypothetical protein
VRPWGARRHAQLNSIRPTAKVVRVKLYRLSQSEFRSWRDRAARSALKERIFAQHGDAQLRAPSGRILGTVRSPEKSARVPIEKSVKRGAHHAVAPSECICREWQKPAGKEDQHHPICVLKGPWEAQQARSPDLPRERVVVNASSEAPDTEPAPPPDSPVVSPPTSASTPTPTERVQAPPPAECVCREWSGAVAGSHHPLCTFRKDWEAQQGRAAPQLVELETGTVIREATDDEVSASKAKSSEDGVGAIELSDGKLYYVKEG